MATKRKTGLRAEEQGLTPPGGDLLPEDFSGDDVLLTDEGAEAGELPQVDVPEISIESLPDGAVDVRTDGFIVLKWHGTRDWPIGLRLGKMAREDVRGVSGELTEDEAGLIAWFQRLPGEVNFRDGTRVVLRYQLVDGYVVDVK